MSSPLIFLFQPKLANGKSDRRIRRLRARGFDVIVDSHLLELYHSIQANLAQSHHLLLVLLAGQQQDNCSAASYLRTLYPSIGILALVGEDTEAACLQLMQSGTDNYCRYDASFQLLLATVLRLLARMGGDAPSGAPVMPLAAARPVHPGNWQLQDNGWMLAGPEEQRIPLTTGERAFMTTLFSQPSLCAEHKLLIAALNSGDEAASVAAQQGRLVLLVSRLRRKFRAHGVTDIPLKSLHSWGYMFTGLVL